MDKEYLIVCLSYGIVLTGERLRVELLKNQLIIYKNIKIYIGKQGRRARKKAEGIRKKKQNGKGKK